MHLDSNVKVPIDGLHRAANFAACGRMALTARGIIGRVMPRQLGSAERHLLPLTQSQTMQRIGILRSETSSSGA
jgi:hypothetical protein